MSTLTILLRILLSAFLGGLIGIEREIHGRAAGLRTHILVCIGSTLFMVTSIDMAFIYGHLGQVDPSRIAAQVVTGIGFLGAGAIIRYGASIRGLTTAASIWSVAAIGLAVGAGMYKGAAITTAVALIVLVLSRLEERMELKQYGRKLEIRSNIASNIDPNEIRSIIEAYGGRIKRIVTSEDKAKREKKLILDIMLSRMYNKEIIAEITSLPGIEEAEWR